MQHQHHAAAVLDPIGENTKVANRMRLLHGRHAVGSGADSAVVIPQQGSNAHRASLGFYGGDILWLLNESEVGKVRVARDADGLFSNIPSDDKFYQVLPGNIIDFDGNQFKVTFPEPQFEDGKDSEMPPVLSDRHDDDSCASNDIVPASPVADSTLRSSQIDERCLSPSLVTAPEPEMIPISPLTPLTPVLAQQISGARTGSRAFQKGHEADHAVADIVSMNNGQPLTELSKLKEDTPMKDSDPMLVQSEIFAPPASRNRIISPTSLCASRKRRRPGLSRSLKVVPVEKVEDLRSSDLIEPESLVNLRQDRLENAGDLQQSTDQSADQIPESTEATTFEKILIPESKTTVSKNTSRSTRIPRPRKEAVVSLGNLPCVRASEKSDSDNMTTPSTMKTQDQASVTVPETLSPRSRPVKLARLPAKTAPPSHEPKHVLAQPLSKLTVMFTGIATDSFHQIVDQLGGSVTETFGKADVLVSDNKIRRTVKLMCCIPTAKCVVQEQWLTDSLSAGHFLDCQTYIVKDPKVEKQYGFKLENTLAQASRCNLLSNKSFWVAEGCTPSPSDFKPIIECSGGIFIEGPPPSSALEDTFVILSPDLEDEIEQFQRQAIPVYDKELILTGILRQSFQPSDFMIPTKIKSTKKMRKKTTN
uniref:BRCT domain-containing protein n=1 Tax=Spongospora subterranea TaxID=70186 RepID=A0A0H5QJP3_9EUKA|eukprot:CRZ02223.1 hypothetical protein [Spongospora subterranea]